MGERIAFEPMVALRGEARVRAEKNWCDIRENDRLIDAYCEKHGLVRKELSNAERHAAIDKALEEGL